MVPAALVFVPYQYRKGNQDVPITQPISTGLACGCSYEEAAISGLCEVIERDAFTLTWQARLGHRLILHETIPPSARELVRRLEDVPVHFVGPGTTQENRRCERPSVADRAAVVFEEGEIAAERIADEPRWLPAAAVPVIDQLEPFETWRRRHPSGKRWGLGTDPLERPSQIEIQPAMDGKDWSG